METPTETTHHLLHVLDFDASQADPAALNIGGFWDRHPVFHGEHSGEPCPLNSDWGLRGPAADVPIDYLPSFESLIAAKVEHLTHGAAVAFCNATYDTPILTAMLSRHRLGWFRHYRTIDVYNYAAGALGVAPTTSSRELADALGVDREAHGSAHNALVDALFARDMLHAARAHIAARTA